MNLYRVSCELDNGACYDRYQCLVWAEGEDEARSLASQWGYNLGPDSCVSDVFSIQKAPAQGVVACFLSSSEKTGGR